MAEKSKKRGADRLLSFIMIPEITSIIPVIVVAVTASILNPIFLRSENLLTLMSSLIASWGILTVGQAFVIMSGGLDISVGNSFTLAGMLFCFLARSKCPLTLCILSIFVVTIAMSILNVTLILKFHVAPFVATMSVSFIGKGLSNVVNFGADMSISYGVRDSVLQFCKILGQKPLGISIGAFVFIALIFIVQFVLKKTEFGRMIYAVGDNYQVAKIAGIRVKRVRVLCFVINGAMIGIATLLWVGYYSGCTPTQGNPWSFITIAAAAMGGISLRGGSGSMFGLFCGVLLMALVYNLITLLNVDANLQNIFIGIFLALAVILDAIRKERTLGKNI